MGELSKNELKPCPFCGGVANIIDHHDDDGTVSVGCDNDTCLGFSGLGWLYGTEAAAMRAWNKRTERTCRNVDEYADAGFFICGACGFGKYSIELTPNYCPGCGAKVVK